MFTRVGTIDTLGGHPMSGLWHLTFLDAPPVMIQSGMGVRALARAFDAHEGSGDIFEKIRGQRIVYSVDEFGVMAGFTPEVEWTGPEIPPEGIEDDEPQEEMTEEEVDHV